MQSIDSENLTSLNDEFEFPEYENGRIHLLEYLEVAGYFASVSMIFDKLGAE